MEIALGVVVVLILELEALVLLMGVWRFEELQQQVQHGRPLDLIDDDLSFFEHLKAVTSSGLVKGGSDCVMPLQVQLVLTDPDLLHSWLFGVVELEPQSRDEEETACEFGVKLD